MELDLDTIREEIIGLTGTVYQQQTAIIGLTGTVSNLDRNIDFIAAEINGKFDGNVSFANQNYSIGTTGDGYYYKTYVIGANNNSNHELNV